MYRPVVNNPIGLLSIIRNIIPGAPGCNVPLPQQPIVQQRPIAPWPPAGHLRPVTPPLSKEEFYEKQRLMKEREKRKEIDKSAEFVRECEKALQMRATKNRDSLSPSPLPYRSPRRSGSPIPKSRYYSPPYYRRSPSRSRRSPRYYRRWSRSRSRSRGRRSRTRSWSRSRSRSRSRVSTKKDNLKVDPRLMANFMEYLKKSSDSSSDKKKKKKKRSRSRKSDSSERGNFLSDV